MKYFILVIGFLFSFFFSANAQEYVRMFYNDSIEFREARREFEEYISNQTPVGDRIPGQKQFDRYTYFIESHLDDNDGRFARPSATWEVYNELEKEISSGKYNHYATWMPVGPFVTPINSPGMGRLNCIAFHPTNENIMYVGAASGGVWKTTNGGNYWHPLSDHLASIGISSIVVDHSNPQIVYAATGDFNNSDTYSIGVVKSYDGGSTWNTTGLDWQVQSQSRISKLLMHPDDSNILYAATSLGIFKTYDAGQSWNSIRAGLITDIEFKPGNPSVIYAIIGTNLWISDNDGTTFSPSGLNYNSSVGRAKVAVTPADSNYIYVLATTASDSGFEGLYKSTDGGTTFSNMSSTPNILGYAFDGSSNGGIAWYCLGLVVSPIDKNEVYAASVNIWKSNNSGSSWNIIAHWFGDQGIPYVHADIHHMAYHPITGALYICSDGGVDITTNGGVSYQQLNDGLMIGQIYRIGLSKQDHRRIIGGWQDNGTHFLNNNTWRHVLGGDGMECIISHSNYNYMYASWQYGNIYRTSDGGNNWIKISDNIPETGAWVTPYIMHPSSHNILLAGYNNIYRTNNFGSTWTRLTNFNTTGHFDKFRSLAYAPSDPNYIYAATYNRIYRSKNGGQTWVQINNNLPSRPISYIAIHNSEPTTLYITMGGFSDGDKVFMSVNSGNIWQNISGNLPNLPANCIIHEKNSPGGLYAGMDVGVFYRDSTLTDWVPFFDGLPNVKISELEIHYDSHKLVAGTYGRGIWWSDTYSWINNVNETGPGKKASFNVFPNPSDGNFNITLNDNSLAIKKVRLYSAMGQLVNIWKPSNKESFISIKNNDYSARSGLYHVVITLINGDTTSGKLIIRR